MFDCGWVKGGTVAVGFVVKMFFDSRRAGELEGVDLHLEKGVQKIGSASDVGLAGFGGPALMLVGLGPGALLVNDTVSGSFPPRAAKNFESFCNLDDLFAS